jgi:hypothetical protein
MSTATAATYTGTFHGRAEEVRRVRHQVARHLGDCPAADDAVLVASEFAANSILHSRSRGQQFTIRVQLHPDHVSGGMPGRGRTVARQASR